MSKKNYITNVELQKTNRLNKRLTTHVFLRGWTEKFINKLMHDGKKRQIKSIVYKSFRQIKTEVNENPKYILLKSLRLLEHEIGFIKFYSKKQARKKRRKRARYIPVPLTLHKRRVIALSWLTKIILFQKRKRRVHNYKNQIRPSKRMSSVSKKKTFEDHFYVSHKDQNLANLIKTKFVDLHKTNFHALIKFKIKFFAKVTNRRAFMNFRWRFKKKSRRLKKHSSNLRLKKIFARRQRALTGKHRTFTKKRNKTPHKRNDKKASSSRKRLSLS